MLPTLSLALSLVLTCRAGVIQQRQAPDSSTGVSLNKIGLAWGGGDADITQYESSKVSWYVFPPLTTQTQTERLIRYYTWGPNNWVQGENNLEYVPMFWGPKNADTFSTYVNQETITSQGIKHVLGMNE